MPAPLAAHMPRKEDVEARKRQAQQRDEERRQAELTLQRVQAEFQSLKRQRDDLRAQYPFEYTSVQWRARLDEQKQKIIAECDAREKSESDAAARAAEEGNAAALAALETQRSQAAEAMTAAAKAHEAEWCAALVQRTLGGEAAQ